MKRFLVHAMTCKQASPSSRGSSPPSRPASSATTPSGCSKRVLGRWMRMLTIPNQSSVPKAFHEFTEDGRMKPSAFYDRVVDVMEEPFKFKLLTRDVAPYLVNRNSERKESAAERSERVNQRAI